MWKNYQRVFYGCYYVLWDESFVCSPTMTLTCSLRFLCVSCMLFLRVVCVFFTFLLRFACRGMLGVQGPIFQQCRAMENEEMLVPPTWARLNGLGNMIATLCIRFYYVSITLYVRCLCNFCWLPSTCCSRASDAPQNKSTPDKNLHRVFA